MLTSAPAAIRFLIVALAFYAEHVAKPHELTGKVVHIDDGDMSEIEYANQTDKRWQGVQPGV